jgi:hypothetical protein
MELNKIKEIRLAIGIQIINSRDLINTEEMLLLTSMANLNDQLIFRLTYPEESKKQDIKFNKLMNGN